MIHDLNDLFNRNRKKLKYIFKNETSRRSTVNQMNGKGHHISLSLVDVSYFASSRKKNGKKKR